MTKGHSGSVAIVTGAAGGIGAAIARGLAARGASIGIIDVDDPSRTIDELGEFGIRVAAETADISNAAEVEGAVGKLTEALGPIDVLVNNAAVSHLGASDELSEGDWRSTLDINVTGTFLVTRAVARGMKALGRGRIVNISSTSLYLNTPRMVSYITSKAGVLGLTSALATELGPHGITVNAVSPGFTNTSMVQREIERGAFPDNIEEAMRSMQAIPRQSSVDDVVGAIAYLTGPESAAVTGQFIAADAGMSRHY